MKKLLRFAGLSGILFTSFLALGMNLSAACAAETPAQGEARVIMSLSSAYVTEALPKDEALVTVNGEPADVHAEMIDGKLYFSLRDYWVNVCHTPFQVQWFPKSQALVHTGSFGKVQEILLLRDQTVFGLDTHGGVPLTDPAILKDGRLLVAASYLVDSKDPAISAQTLIPQLSLLGNMLDFRTTLWERWRDDKLADTFCLRADSIPLDPETGLPDWAHTSLSMFNDDHGGRLFMDWEDLEVTKTKLQDGTLFFHYVSQKNPKNSLLVTVRDGYVRKMAEYNSIFPIEVCY